MKKLFVFAMIFLLIPSVQALTCSVKTSCSAGEVDVFHMSSTTNAHAELPSENNYNYKVCCSQPGTTLGNSCSGVYAVVLRASSATNAHVEENIYNNYGYTICLSSLAQSVSCIYSDDCSNAPSPGYECLASISSATNAHVGDCNAYPIKVCCKVSVCSYCTYAEGGDPNFCKHCNNFGTWDSINEGLICDVYSNEVTPPGSQHCLNSNTGCSGLNIEPCIFYDEDQCFAHSNCCRWNPLFHIGVCLPKPCNQLTSQSSCSACSGCSWVSSKVCDLACSSGSCSSKVNCVCEVGRCGASCVSNSDCDDGDSCTIDTCNNDCSCSHTRITSCINNDNCCPTGCNANNDNDCLPQCGNGVVEAGEECEPPNTNLPTCDQGGETYFADRCDANCQIVDRDDICRAPGSLSQVCGGVNREPCTSYDEDQCFAHSNCCRWNPNIDGGACLPKPCNQVTLGDCAACGCSLQATDGCTADLQCSGTAANTVCSQECKYPNCTLKASPPSGVGPFNSQLTATYYNLPSSLIGNNANMTCNQTDPGTLVPLDPNNQAQIACSYPAVSSPTFFTAFSNLSIIRCSLDIFVYDPHSISFEAWLGMSSASLTAAQEFPLNVYVKNKGTIKDSYTIASIPSQNVEIKVYDDVIKDVTPGKVGRGKLGIVPAIVSGETVYILVNSTLAPNLGVALPLTVSSGVPALSDLDEYSVFQLTIFMLVVLLVSRLVRRPEP